MSSLFLRHFPGPCDRQVAAGPEANLIWQSLACAHHKVGDRLEAGKLHSVTGLLRVVILHIIFRGAAGKEPLDHELKESVLRGQLCPAAESDLSDAVYGVSFLCVPAGEPDADMVLPQPLKEADKSGVNPQNIRADGPIFFIKFK